IVYGAQGGKNLKIKLEKIKEENMEDKNVIRSDFYVRIGKLGGEDLEKGGEDQRYGKCNKDKVISNGGARGNLIIDFVMANDQICDRLIEFKIDEKNSDHMPLCVTLEERSAFELEENDAEENRDEEYVTKEEEIIVWNRETIENYRKNTEVLNDMDKAKENEDEEIEVMTSATSTNTPSPSYAAVTAGLSLTRNTSTAARSRTAAKSAALIITGARKPIEAAATKTPPTTAMVSEPLVVSIETVSLSPITRGSPSGSQGEISTPILPATSLRPTSPEPEWGQEERRQEGAARLSTSPIVEGDSQWSGQWMVSVGRRARRSQMNNKSSSNFESLPTAGLSRSPCVTPLSALIVASMNMHESGRSVGQPSQDHPVLATVARQRRRDRVVARDALLDRAKDVATIAHLEAFAAFFGEDASAASAAARARDRSVRSREAGARRGARGGDRPEKEGAGRPDSAPAEPGASGEARGD
ncbi:hypothetical protein ALC56_08086, partial [Trachymyrmex septentrionalis]